VSFSVAQKTLQRLEWPRIVARLHEQCRTPQARRSLLPPSDADAEEAEKLATAIFSSTDAELRERLTLTSEARALLDAERAPGLGGISELEPAFERVGKGGTLASLQLRDIAAALAALHDIAAALRNCSDEAPLLAELADTIGDHRDLQHRIDWCIDPSGEVTDQASPALRAARGESSRMSGELQRRLERLLRSGEIREALSDQFVTVRNDRYVLPVRADMRSRVRGIVHDASNTGTTLFIEPEAVVELNNRLKQAELEAAREVERVLRELSGEVAAATPSLRASLRMLAEIDLAFARGRLSQDMAGVEPVLDDAGRFELLELRHPLIPSEDAVPNDLRLGRDYHVLVISGPNAGGKTVAMKAVALAALLLRAGMHVPAAAGARLPIVDAVLADIGDEQDIRESLSTFSAHMANLSAIVSSAGPRTLAVLDEIGTGTDPGEGAAIAQAILEALADAGARVIATTHYNLLKEMAEVDERFCNASVEFDPRTLEPTYRLHVGTAGASSATAVAARMGMPDHVLERSNALLDREDRQLDRILSELAASRAALEQEQREVANLRVESESVRDRYREKLERLQERRDSLFRSMREDLDRAFSDAHGQVAAVIRDLQRRGTAQEAAHARNRLQGLQARAEQAAAEVGVDTTRSATAAPQTDARGRKAIPVDWQHAKAGDTVVVRGGVAAVLETLPDRRGKVRVLAGSARLVLSAGEVRSVPALPDVGEDGKRSVRPKRATRIAVISAAGDVREDDLPRGGSLECDLRGMRVREALDRLDEDLDRAAAESRDLVRIIHGIGTGALRSAVREHLASSPLVQSLRSGDAEHGGAGVTEALLD
jgi:DNA mismatch repair protein MutS2